MKSTDKKLCYYITMSCYVFLSFAVFTPVFNSQNITATLLFCFITSLLTVSGLSFLFGKALPDKVKSSFPTEKNRHGLLNRALSVITCLSGLFSVLLIMTQVIKDTCYIAGKGVSKEYYLGLSAALLAVSLYLCFNSEKGIYRFCITASVPVLIFVISALLPLFTVKNIVFDLFATVPHSTIKEAFKGCYYGLFFCLDISVFLYCFKECTGFSRPSVRLGIFSVITAFMLWCICIVSANLIFGKNLIFLFSDPLYALTKAFDGFDITETLSAIRIFAFIIKSSVYLYSSALSIKNAFCKKAHPSLKKILCSIYVTIPIIYIPFLITTTDFGKLQHLVYPSVIIMSALFTLSGILQKNKN